MRGLCQTWKYRKIKQAVLFLLGLILIGVLYFSVHAMAKPKIGNYLMETNAKSGVPAVAEEYYYSNVAVKKGYELKICGNPKIEGNKVYLYPTNPMGNQVWFKVVVLDENSSKLGESGILKQNQHTEFVELYEPITAQTKVTLLIVAYEPNSFESAGNVSLETVLQP